MRHSTWRANAATHCSGRMCTCDMHVQWAASKSVLLVVSLAPQEISSALSSMLTCLRVDLGSAVAVARLARLPRAVVVRVRSLASRAATCASRNGLASKIEILESNEINCFQHAVPFPSGSPPGRRSPVTHPGPATTPRDRALLLPSSGLFGQTHRSWPTCIRTSSTPIRWAWT